MARTIDTDPMFDCTDIEGVIEGNDERSNDEFLRCLTGDSDRGSLLVIGVVHDHPASTARVAQVLESISPDILALELPPLAMGLFRLYAADDNSPPRLGGEMSMALEASKRARSVGIDAPNRQYLWILLERLATARPASKTVRAALSDLVSATTQAVACRLAEALGSVTPIRLRTYAHITYDSTLLDAPADQAADERSHLKQHEAFLRAIQRPPGREFIDSVREESMVTRLSTLREEGDVVAIVGMEHLDPLYARLRET